MDEAHAKLPKPLQDLWAAKDPLYRGRVAEVRHNVKIVLGLRGRKYRRNGGCLSWGTAAGVLHIPWRSSDASAKPPPCTSTSTPHRTSKITKRTRQRAALLAQLAMVLLAVSWVASSSVCLAGS